VRPESERRPARQRDAANTQNSLLARLAGAGDRDGVLELSGERDRWQARVLAAEVRGFRLGYVQGRQDEAAERDAYWKRTGEFMLSHADPAGPEARERVNGRLAAALAFERAEAWAHWRKRWSELFALSRDPEFVRQARAVKPTERSYGQIMAIVLADRPSRQGGAAA